MFQSILMPNSHRLNYLPSWCIFLYMPSARSFAGAWSGPAFGCRTIPRQQSERNLRLGWEGRDSSDLTTSLRFWITYSLLTAVLEMFYTAYTLTFHEMEVTNLGEGLPWWCCHHFCYSFKLAAKTLCSPRST